MSIGLQYFLLNLFFISIIILIIVIWLYAKWHIIGPKFSSWRHRNLKKITSKFDKSQPKIKRGAVIDTSNVTNDLDLIENETMSAQELLEIQSKRDQHEKEIKRLEDELKQKEEEKNKKKEIKEKQKEAKQKQKEVSKKLKEEKKKGDK